MVLFSGGYGYLGSASVQYLALRGARVFVLSRSKEKFDKEFSGLNNITYVFCDVSDTDSIRNAYDVVQNTHGRIDAIINNAFYSRGQSPEAMTDEDFSYGIDGVLGSVFRGIREIIPIFKAQKWGKVINISSMYGVVAPDFSVYVESPASLNPPHYGAAKAGVIQLTKYYASYLGKFNIQVNAVTPGPFPSDEVKDRDPSFVKRLSDNTLLGRVGVPKDLIGVIVLLLSDGSNFITGQNFIVDGGWTTK
ncbi:SDR family oxidoreductase [Sphingobacterium sp. DR205]|nr:SDR family oxidoreductase [Sphingobacterium sp. DR205]